MLNPTKLTKSLEKNSGNFSCLLASLLCSLSQLRHILENATVLNAMEESDIAAACGIYCMLEHFAILDTFSAELFFWFINL